MARQHHPVFIEQPILRCIGATGRWLLHENWECKLPDGAMLMVPKGFVTDLASVPDGLHWIIDQDELSAAAALAHDVGYGDGGVLCIEWLEPYKVYSRREVDEWLRFLAIASGARPWKASAAYYAVRLFASLAWKPSVR